MDVLLDGSFMLNAMKLKIDFLNQLSEMGFTVKVPREVLQELKDLRVDSKMDTRAAIDQIFELIEKRKVKKLGLGAGAVDAQLIKLGKAGAYIATMDAALRRVVPNKVILSTTTKQITVERS
jgi:rRNA-processing protein FCF1